VYVEEWALARGVSDATALRWFRAGSFQRLPARPALNGHCRRFLALLRDPQVRDVTGILTSLCARLYGRRAAAGRAARAVAAVTAQDPS
jgi:predicted site-specific integrase-resolvase